MRKLWNPVTQLKQLCTGQSTEPVTAGYRLSPPEKMPKSVRSIMTKCCFPGNPEERSRMSEIRAALEDVMQPQSIERSL
ncbi:hypothetical protein COOONC_19198 [Cooperia oncophora]